jgi:hypothetical protein
MCLQDLARRSFWQDPPRASCKTHHSQDRSRESCKYLRDLPRPLFGKVEQDGAGKILQDIARMTKIMVWQDRVRCLCKIEHMHLAKTEQDDLVLGF